MMNNSYFAGTKDVVHDLIRLSDSDTKEQSVCALYKSIKKVYRLFQVEIQKVLVNEKKLNRSNINLEYFDDLEEVIRQREVWAKCSSC